MSQTLVDVVANMSGYDEEMTIYARKPWTCDSVAVVAREPDDELVPPEARGVGAAYFLEVFVAKEFLDGWIAGLGRPASARDQCERLIGYAVDDA